MSDVAEAKTDYSEQDALIAQLDPKGRLSLETWKFFAADWAVALGKAQAQLAERDALLSKLVLRMEGTWRDVGPGNNDMCALCESTITARQQEAADGEGWDYIEHKADCPVLLLAEVARVLGEKERD